MTKKTKKAKMKTVTFTAPPDLQDKVVKYADARDLTFSQIVRKAILEYLDRSEHKQAA